MTDKLKPCPFCGSDDIEAYYATVKCLECGADGPIFNIGNVETRSMKDIAIAAWNKRQGENE